LPALAMAQLSLELVSDRVRASISVIRRMSVRRLLSSAALALIVPVLLASCGGEGGGDCGGFVAPQRTLTPNVSTLTFDGGGQTFVTATLSGGCPGDPTTVNWVSSDPTIASVTNTGAVQATAPGTVTLTATAFDGVTRTTVTVTVRALAAARIIVSPRIDTLSPNGVRTYTAVVLDQRDSVLRLAQVVWRTITPVQASVSGTGVVSAVGLGTARIVATTQRVGTDSLRDTVTIEVVNPCTRIRGLALGATYDGQIDSSSCRNFVGLRVLDQLRIADQPAGTQLSYLLSLTPRFRGSLVPMNIGSGMYGIPAVNADSTSSAIVVISGSRVTDPNVGFIVTSPDSLRPGTFSYRVTTSANPDPTQRCSITAVTRVVDFQTALYPASGSVPGCTTRDVEILPLLLTGTSINIQGTASAFPVTLQLQNFATNAVVASASAVTTGATATINYTAPAGGGVFLRLRVLGAASSNGRVRLVIN
jgi:hypothetical protein